MSVESVVPRRPEWLRRRERGSTATIRLCVALALYFGRAIMHGFLPLICLYFLAFSPASRRASRLYLSRVLDRRATLYDVFRHYRVFAACVLDRVYFLRDGAPDYDIRIFGEEIVLDILARGGGCILLGAHIGSFEVLRAIGHRHPNLRVNMLMYEENARKLSAVLNAINPELAAEIIRLGRPDSFITVRDCLDKGHFVGLLADRSLSDEWQVALPFLGAPAQFSVNPFRMMALLQRPVVLMIGLYRGGRRYDVHIEEVSVAAKLSRRPDAEELRLAVADYVRRLEHYCRLAPYNWFNFYDVWK